MLNNNRGRSNSNNNLRERWRRSKSTSKYSEERVFLHAYVYLQCDVVQSDFARPATAFCDVEHDLQKRVASVLSVSMVRR